MPVCFLKKRVKCCGYSNPSSSAACVTDSPPTIRLLARSMRKRWITCVGLSPETLRTTSPK